MAEMVEGAIQLGFTALGISDHGPVPVESDWNMSFAETPSYIAEAKSLQKKFPQLLLLCGVEIDYLKKERSLTKDFLNQFDYTIGSLHYLYTEEGYQLIDYNAESFSYLFNKIFDGNIGKLARQYSNQLCEMIELYNPTLLGHIDLISKFNQKKVLFDESASSYLTPLQDAIQFAKEKKIIIEINTGAISRGYRNIPYPALPLLNFCKEKNIMMTLNGDSHTTEGLNGSYEATLANLREIGIHSLYQLEKSAERLEIKEVLLL